MLTLDSSILPQEKSHAGVSLTLYMFNVSCSYQARALLEATAGLRSAAEKLKTGPLDQGLSISGSQPLEAPNDPYTGVA